ncbi:ATP-binding SpoIIE family protein phosphatase [Streptomyces sp. NPDC047108]|uniref:ATP-binding SpoIIE family protein phosphatase n=1 Tax=Streptomyces sp. NPDC047108 TaxID=3155025 RepID=UPI0033DC661F
MNFTRWSARLPGTQRRAAARTDRGSRPRKPPGAAGSGSPVPAARVERPGAAALPALPVASASPDPRITVGGLSVQDVLEQVPGLVAVVYGPEHRIAYVNDAYAAVFGAGTPGRPAREALPELAELGLLPLMDQVLRSGTSRTVKSRRVPAARGETAKGEAARGDAFADGLDDAPASGDTDLPQSTGTGRARPGHYTFTCSPIDLAAPSGPLEQGARSVCAPGAHTNAPNGAAAAPASSAPATATHRGVLVFATDVTDQVEAAERLRTSERRQRQAAVTLQRSLLPQELEEPDDLRIAATYQPGGTEAAVGGDWYDVITLGAGRTALVIGDVMGRGVRAAAVMGQLRTAVRAYARLDLPPHEVLQLLDGLASEIDPSQIATCAYAVHDPNEGRLVYASAGHLPIILRDEDGTVRRAAEPTGPPLGTGGWLHTSGSVPFGPGATAVLYTDGLVERRGEDIDEGVTALEQALAGATGTPQVVCDRMIRALGVTADHDDDVAVLVLQHPARTGHDAELFHNAALELLGGVEAAPRARAFASGVLASWRFPMELRDLGVLAASELVANSLQHGTPPMRLRLRRTDRRLIVEVTDGDDHLPRRRRAEPVDEAGRGISIVATIASAWGSRRTPGGGKAVWCEFALPEE